MNSDTIHIFGKASAFKGAAKMIKAQKNLNNWHCVLFSAIFIYILSNEYQIAKLKCELNNLKCSEE